jgi:hypothetical protein
MDNSNAQRQARWRQRQKARSAAGSEELAKARARIAVLESVLKQAQRAAPSMSSREDLKARNAELESEVISLRRALKQAQAAAAATAKTPRPPKPPIDPDSEVARYKTANKNLRNKLAHMERWYEKQLFRSGKMPLATLRAIAKCLHPDYTPSAEEREHACKLFNVFTDSARGK